jgi:hypothetical protein
LDKQARIVAAPITLLMPGAGPPAQTIAIFLRSLTMWRAFLYHDATLLSEEIVGMLTISGSPSKLRGLDRAGS